MMVAIGVRSMGRIGLAGLALWLLGPTASGPAEVPLVATEAAQLGLSLEVSTGAFATSNTNFGAGSNGEAGHRWWEAYLKPGLAGSAALPGGGSLYGGWSGIWSSHGGDGAPGDSEAEGEYLAQEDLYAGWRSGTLFPGLGEDFFDLSFGQQRFQLGDGFLIWDGTSDGGDHANFWLGPRKAFRRAAVARLNGKPWRGDLFWLESHTDTTELAGLNLEYAHDALGTLGAAFLHAATAESPTRHGLRVYDLRGHGTPFAAWGLTRLTLRFEGVIERNDEAGGDLRAQAYYGELAYELPLLWTPVLSYRYSHFSGDDPATTSSEDFDPLFYGFGRGWGTWYQGEIVGEYLLFNQNENVHMVHLKATPAESLTLGVLYFNFRLDEPPAGVSAQDFADEVNLYADWQATDWLLLSGAAGIAVPDTVARQIYGDDQNFRLVEIIATVNF
ncbi:MAG: hypothetical protein AB1634_18695 [Thermodesulfobacteriota bacterium]